MKVKVMEVDVQRKRIALTMRLNDEPGQESRPARSSQPRQERAPRRRDEPSNAGGAMSGAFAAAFAKAKK